jgi:hypothetical protein
MFSEQGFNFCCWYFIEIDPMTRPLSRNFFKGEHKGSKLLLESNLQCLEEVKSNSIELELSRIATSPEVTPLDDQTMLYMNEKMVAI